MHVPLLFSHLLQPFRDGRALQKCCNSEQIVHTTETKEQNHLFPAWAQNVQQNTDKAQPSRLHTHLISSFLIFFRKISNSPLEILPPHLLSILSQPFQGERGFHTHCDSGFSWHASCISRHGRSGSRWHLNATRASSQSVRKRPSHLTNFANDFNSDAQSCAHTPQKKMCPYSQSKKRRHCPNQGYAARHRGIFFGIMGKPFLLYWLNFPRFETQATWLRADSGTSPALERL